MCISVKCGPSRVAETTRPHRPDEVRHKETNCTRTHRNGEKPTGEAVEKTGAKRNGPKRTGIPAPISGPRYRGSNPCLPATTRFRTTTYTVQSGPRADCAGPLFGAARRFKNPHRFRQVADGRMVWQKGP